MRIEDLDFELPDELIAQFPSDKRAESRLLHYQRTAAIESPLPSPRPTHCTGEGVIAHRRFSDLPKLLRAGDLMVFNDAKVIPARFMLLKSTGGRVEGLFLREDADGYWDVLLRNVGRSPVGMGLVFERVPDTELRIIESSGEGLFKVQVSGNEPAMQLLDRIGRMPLPPYIRRQRGQDARDESDRQRYQTVYARNEGSVAAPTAGLHFDDETLAELGRLGVRRAFVTLHVGMGTFKPITAPTIEQHVMHEESYTISTRSADELNLAKMEGRRIIAVGTTAARALESQPGDQPFEARDDRTAIFIRPPYRWKNVDALITNFHLPRSTLIALVAALVGLEEQRRLYRIAIENRYRFFSYGDAMFIE